MAAAEESSSVRRLLVAHRRTVRAAVVGLVVFGCCFGNSLGWALYNSSYAAAAGCRYVQLSTPEAAAENSFRGPGQPYGPILACRMVSRRLGWFGRPDTSSSILLLLARRGMVLVRLDYRDVQSRQMRVAAVELPSGDAPGSVTPGERDRLRHDVAARGGVRPGEWILVYGDG